MIPFKRINFKIYLQKNNLLKIFFCSTLYVIIRYSFFLFKSLYHISVCNVNFKLNSISTVLKKKNIIHIVNIANIKCSLDRLFD